jgi:soluble lytic murein transglycosylase-like protein
MNLTEIGAQQVAPTVLPTRRFLSVTLLALTSYCATLVLPPALVMMLQSDSTSSPAAVARPANETPAPRAALVEYISGRWGVDDFRAADIIGTATVVAKKESVDPLLVLAVVANESSFVHMGNRGDRSVDIPPEKVNPLYSHGPMQVAGRWHREEMPVDANGRIRVTTTTENIEIGTRLLGRYLKREGGNVTRALLRYNGTLDDEQAKYAARVLRFRRDFQRALLES